VKTSLMRQFLAFLAVLVAGMAMAALVITITVTRAGLTDLFRDRLQRTGAVLEQYLGANRAAWTSDVETLLTSPRFLAALETADPSTIAREMPTHGLLDGADVAWVEAPDGSPLYESRADLVSELRRRTQSTVSPSDGLSVTILDTGGTALELLRADIVSNNGAFLGHLFLGRDVARAWVEDLERLTGFDVVLLQAEQLIGQSERGGSGGAAALAPLLHLPKETAQSVHLGDESVLAFRASGEDGISAVFLGNPDAAIAPILTSERRLLFVLACVGAVVSLAAVWLFTRKRIVPRVEELVSHAARIAAGDLDFSIRPAAPDELGLIAAALERMRADLQRSRQELEEAHRMQLDAERMAAIGQMATGVVHDFKNPMAVVQGTTELIQRRLGDDEKLVKQCTTIQRQIDRMLALTRDLLEYARGKTELEVENVRLVEWLREIEAGHGA
jgi:signal transduction histidine kinase